MPDSHSHQYVSTACQHGEHAQCRRNCKFCNAACGCPCGHVVQPQPRQCYIPLDGAKLKKQPRGVDTWKSPERQSEAAERDRQMAVVGRAAGEECALDAHIARWARWNAQDLRRKISAWRDRLDTIARNSNGPASQAVALIAQEMGEAVEERKQ